MKTKIEEAKDLKRQLEFNKREVQYCLGRKKLEDGTFILDSRNDKHNFKFSVTRHHSSRAIYLDAYYGYFGDSNVSMLDNEFYICCMAEAINKFLPQIREETEKIMEQKYYEALLEAKSEADEILKTIKELGLNSGVSGGKK